MPVPVSDDHATAPLTALASQAAMPLADLLASLGSGEAGLDATTAADRLRRHGPNRIAEQERLSLLRELWGKMRSPLNALLRALAAMSLGLGDPTSATVIAVMVVLSTGLGFV